MLLNHLKIALRKLSRQRDFALLNILGLGLSVGCSLLIFALIRYHNSFDTYHKHADRVMRIVMDVKTETIMPFSGAPNPMAKALREDCSFVEQAAMRSAEAEVLISVPQTQGAWDKYKEKEKFAWVEPGYFDILDLPLAKGDIGAMTEPNTVVISENLAKKYFGATEALGKTIRVDNHADLRIVGVLHDLPANTDYKQEILGSWATLKSISANPKDLDDWGGARGENFCLALLKEGHQRSELDATMAEFCKKYPHPESKDLFNYKAKAMLGLHFDTDYGRGIDKKFLWALGCIGLFLLITACFNFINMATAQALNRTREVGVRKSLGSTRGQLFWQFIAETGLIVLSSLLLGWGLARLALPYLNAWMKETLLLAGPLMSEMAAFTLLLGIVLTFMAGFYPGMMLARYNPVISMKGTGEVPRKGHFSLRKMLVAGQFGISQLLIIGAAVITLQMQYAQDADWGFRPGAILTLEVPESAKMSSLQQQLQQIAGVKSVSLCYQPPASSSNNFSGVTYEHRANNEPWLVSEKPADDQYLETFGLQLVAGRNLQHSDTTREFLVNQTFVKKLNLASPDEILNKAISVGSEKGAVVGVIKDFHNWSLAEPIAAIAIGSRASSYATCAIQLQPGNPAPTLARIKSIWQSQFPERFYEQKFMDEWMGEFLESDLRIMLLVRTFAGIAVFIGCLGLYGLAAFMVNRKRKEVGVRKTLGASVPGILWLFGKEYARLILFAFAGAAPLAWWVMNGWLQDYAYRISMGAGIFILSLLTTVLVAVLTVGIQSVRAALTNPAQSLKSE